MGSNLFVILGLVLGVIVLVLCTVKFKIHPFFALIATTVTFAVVSGMNMQDMLDAFTSGMGGTMADIGLVIALGTVTGALVSIPVMLVGYFCAVKMGKKHYYIPQNVVEVPENHGLPADHRSNRADADQNHR